MRALATLAVLLAAAACSPRADVHAKKPEPLPPLGPDITAAFMRETGPIELDPVTPFVPELDPPRSYPTLGELARAESWPIPPCAGDTCAGLVEKASASGFVTAPASPDRPLGPAITELRLVGTASAPYSCTWRVVVKSTRGWLPSYTLGESAAGCTRPYDATVVEPDVDVWFPLATTSDASGLRLEGQGSSLFPYDDGTYDATTSQRYLLRVVHLCRVGPLGPDHVACARRATHAPDRPHLTATAPTLAPDATFAPLAELSRAGRDDDATWLASRVPPAAEGTLDLFEGLGPMYTGRILEARVGERTVVVPIAHGWPRILLLDDSKASTLASLGSDFENEEVRLEGFTVAGGIVRARFVRENIGPLRVTRRWEDIVTPRFHARLATGVTIDDGSGERGWARKVDADAERLTLAAARGELAWFRGTGHFTWDALVDVAPRWQRAFAKAWVPTRAPRTRRYSDEMGKAVVMDLPLLPGFIEPLEGPVVDQIRALP